jgi:uncharacterized protein YqeY
MENTMSLKEQLQADLKTAMLNKDAVRRDVIRFTQAALKNVEMTKNQKLVEERVHLWRTGEVDANGDPIINVPERDKQLAEIAKLTPLTDAEQLAVLATEVKRRRDTITELEKVNRPDLLKHEQDQLEVLLAYLPKQMSREEIEAVVKQVIAELGVSGPQATGAVMGKLMPQLKGKADGKLINEVVRDLLK